MSVANYPAEGSSTRVREREREAEGSGGGESIQGRKRARYIAKACNECKRRKIKCNGQKPCQRCGQYAVDCTYATPTSTGPKHSKDMEQLHAQIGALRDQVDALSVTLTTLSSQNDAASVQPALAFDDQALPLPTTSSQRNEPSPARLGTPTSTPRWTFASSKRASFHGPITSAFSLNVAKSSLETRGITEFDGAITGRDLTQEPSPVPSPSLSTDRSLEGQGAADPLWAIGKEEARRLCHVYEEEMGMMYPILSPKQTLKQVDLLYAQTGSTSLHHNTLPYNACIDAPHSDDINVLRMVFACALTAQGGGRSELALRLFNSVRDTTEKLIWGPPEIEGVLILTLVSMFYFQMDEEALAWRIIGIVGRMCLELGLHRRESLRKREIEKFGMERAVKLFWSVYVLDMRWSLGTGMSCVLQDIDIDPNLSEPDETTPYLRVMVDYSRIAVKVWSFVAAFNNTNQIKKDEMAYLDWQVLQWFRSIPDPLRLVDGQGTQGDEHHSRGIRRLRSLLYLRAKQMRILIYRPILHSAAHMVRNAKEADTVVNIANDTIRFVMHLNKTSNIYQLQQITFNWFLVSALVVLFLAVAQAPGQYSSRCKEEFYMALELVKSFSTQSYVSKRLWRSIRSLRMLAPKVGLQKDEETTAKRNATSHTSMADSTADIDPFEALQEQYPLNDFPLDGLQMSQELMGWFKAIGDSENPLFPGGVQDMPNAGTGYPNTLPNDGYQTVGYGEGLSSLMRDCF